MRLDFKGNAKSKSRSFPAQVMVSALSSLKEKLVYLFKVLDEQYFVCVRVCSWFRNLETKHRILYFICIPLSQRSWHWDLGIWSLILNITLGDRAYHICRSFVLRRADLRERCCTCICLSKLNCFRFASETPINFCYQLWNAWCFSKACRKELFGVRLHWSIWFGSEFHIVASLLINHINLFMSPGEAVHI